MSVSSGADWIAERVRSIRSVMASIGLAEAFEHFQGMTLELRGDEYSRPEVIALAHDMLAHDDLTEDMLLSMAKYLAIHGDVTRVLSVPMVPFWIQEFSEERQRLLGAAIIEGYDREMIRNAEPIFGGLVNASNAWTKVFRETMSKWSEREHWHPSVGEALEYLSDETANIMSAVKAKNVRLYVYNTMRDTLGFHPTMQMRWIVTMEEIRAGRGPTDGRGDRTSMPESRMVRPIRRFLGEE